MNNSNSTEDFQPYWNHAHNYWHRKGLDIVIISLSLRLAALLFVGLNAGYLRCTRGLGSVRIKSVTSFPERCCKARSGCVCNVMILIHVALLIAEMMTAVILTCLSHDLRYWFWLLVFFDYFLLLLCIVCPQSRFCTRQSHDHVGCLHALSAFEFVNLIIFWVMMPLMAVHLPFFVFGHAFLFGWTSIAISYIVLLYGAWRNYKRFRLYRVLISKSEATEKMKKILEEKPSIEWHIKWNRSGEDGKIHVQRYLVVLTFAIALLTFDRVYEMLIFILSIFKISCYLSATEFKTKM